jgi:hypothetical protein
VDDRVATLLIPGANVTINYNDFAGTLTVSAATPAAGTMPFTPTGNIAATNVQDAIAEVDFEKVAKAGDVMTGHLSLPAGPSFNQAVRKDYVDGVANTLQTNINGKVFVSGDTMTGHLGLPSGPAADQAVRRDYVDAADSSLQTQINGKADTVHTHTASQITDFSEATDDRVAALLQAGTNVTLNYNDAANTLTINSSGGGGGTGNVTLTCSDTPPVDPAVNDLWWKTNSGGMYVFYDDGSSTQWVQTGTASSDGGGSGNIIASDTPPPFPTDNTVWWKSDSGATYIWFNDGSSSQWVQTGDGSGGGGSARITSSDTPPAFPLPDDLWWKSNSGVMFIYFDDGTSSQWVETGAASSRVFIGDTAPVAPVDGMMWWKSNSGVTYVRFNDGSSSQWVAMGGAS